MDESLKDYQTPFVEKEARIALRKTVGNLSKKGFEEVERKTALLYSSC